MPQDTHPTELRKCPICKKMKAFYVGSKLKTCEECRAYARNYKKQHQKPKPNPAQPSKEMLAEVERIQKEKHEELRLKYSTTNPDCLKCREMIDTGSTDAFKYNHLDVCSSCQRYLARHKPDSLDVNQTKGEKYPEYEGYNEAFGSGRLNLFPEDYARHGHFIAPMVRCCSTCGIPLDERGRCPVCEPYY